jgi:hypothetical protein
MAEQYPGVIVTPKFTVLFPNLFEPKAVTDPKTGKQSEPAYSITMLFDPEDIKPLWAVMLKVAKLTWPGIDEDELRRKNWPMKDGNKEAERARAKGKNGDFYDGKKVLKAKSKFQPGILGPDKRDLLNPKRIYSGCVGVAELNFNAYDGFGGGVNAYLNHFMLLEDGPKLVGHTAQDAFSGIEGRVTDVDPTAGGTNPFSGQKKTPDDLDDEIPF